MYGPTRGETITFFGCLIFVAAVAGACLLALGQYLYHHVTITGRWR